MSRSRRTKRPRNDSCQMLSEFSFALQLRALSRDLTPDEKPEGPDRSADHVVRAVDQILDRMRANGVNPSDYFSMAGHVLAAFQAGSDSKLFARILPRPMSPHQQGALFEAVMTFVHALFDDGPAPPSPPPDVDEPPLPPLH